MKIIFLNCWYAEAGKAFFDFVERESKIADIFCFQEVSPDLYSTLTAFLPGHRGLYEGSKVLLLGRIKCGQAIFIKKRFNINTSIKIPLYRELKNDVGFLQYVSVNNNLFIGNLQGKAMPGHKLDTPARLRQSKAIISFFQDKKGLKIIGGDFNLMPGTKSIKMLEEAGYRNLIKDFKISNTRNRLAWERFPNEKKQFFADYVFVSPEIKVEKFLVPDLQISDHLPLILDFEV